MKRITVFLVLLLACFPLACDDSSDSGGSDSPAPIEIRGSWFNEDAVAPTFYYVFTIIEYDVIWTTARTDSVFVSILWGTLLSYNNSTNTCIINWADVESPVITVWKQYQKMGWSDISLSGTMTLRVYEGASTRILAEAETSYDEYLCERKLP